MKKTMWSTLAKMVKMERKLMEDAGQHFSVIHCSCCETHVHLPKKHWCHPTPNEDLTFWMCPPCLNKDRTVRGKRRINRYGKTV